MLPIAQGCGGAPVLEDETVPTTDCAATVTGKKAAKSPASAFLGLDPCGALNSGDLPALSWARCAMFLDVDGTMLDFAATPDRVIVPQGLRESLERLRESLGGALAIVSGRSLESLDRLFEPLVLAAGAQHGLEWRDSAGSVHNVAHGPLPPEIREAFTVFATQHPGALVEEKGSGLALHVRNVPEAEPAARALGASLAIRHASRVRMIGGKRVVELQLQGGDKGRAIERFMASPPFVGRVPLFAGDDETDEAGFVTVNRLGGLSICVGGDGPTQARCRIASPEAFRRWLADVAKALSTPCAGREAS